MVRFITDSSKRPSAGHASLLVIGAGLPRAATSSMQAAFEQLGFQPCMHMAEIIPHPAREQLLLDAMRETDRERRQKLLKELVGGYVAICDVPAVAFVPELMDMYPDAKVVLNGRPNSELWARSCAESLGFFFTPWFKWAGMLWKTDRLWYALNMECRRYCKANFGADDLFTAKMYETYHESVRAEAAKRGKEVLEFKAEDGWEPLCGFLQKDVPNTPFPRLNEKKTFAVIKAIIIAKGLFSWAALFGSGWVMWQYGPAFVHRSLKQASRLLGA